MSEAPEDASHDEQPQGPSMALVILGSLAIFVIGCALVIAFAIR
jgi:hypothetical protein